MNVFRWLSLSCVLFIASVTDALARSADVECKAGRYPTAASVTAPMFTGPLTLGSQGELRWIDLIWLREDETDRLREFVTIDFRNDRVSPVREFDISVPGISEPDVDNARVVPERSDFDTGRVTVDFCMDGNALHGVAIAYYQYGVDENGKALLSGKVTAFRPDYPAQYFTAFGRSGQWASIGFDRDALIQTGNTSARLLQMVELATGVQPEAYLGSSMVIEAAGLADIQPPDFIAPHNSRVQNRQVVVTGPDASVLASPAVTSVQFRGEELLGEDGVLRGLSADRSPLRVQLGEETGAPSYLMPVIEGRLGATLDAGSCVNGAPITGRLTRTTQDDGLRFASTATSLSFQEYVPVTDDGKFEITSAICREEQLLLTSNFGDRLWLEFANLQGGRTQAQLCPSFLPGTGEGFPCITLPVADIAELFQVTPQELAGGETFELLCGESRGGIDTIDAFVRAAESALAPIDLARVRTLLRADEGTLEDQDGDGSICNIDDLRTSERIISWLRVNVALNVR